MPDATLEALTAYDAESSRMVSVPYELLRHIRTDLLRAAMTSDLSTEHGATLAETCERDRQRLMQYVPYED